MKVEVGLLIALVALAMIAFGLPDGLLAIAWPSMSDTFGVAVTSLGGVIIVFTVAYAVASSASGWFLRKVGLGTFLTIGAAVTGLSFAGYAVVPGWWMLFVVAGGAGAGGAGGCGARRASLLPVAHEAAGGGRHGAHELCAL